MNRRRKNTPPAKSYAIEAWVDPLTIPMTPFAKDGIINPEAFPVVNPEGFPVVKGRGLRTKLGDHDVTRDDLVRCPSDDFLGEQDHSHTQEQLAAVYRSGALPQDLHLLADRPVNPAKSAVKNKNRKPVVPAEVTIPKFWSELADKGSITQQYAANLLRCVPKTIKRHADRRELTMTPKKRIECDDKLRILMRKKHGDHVVR